ncbi:hypothetical protein [Hungatella hathewayi]|uniref:Cell wall-binding repeat protein n=1 Tax=Hungatella hathewayi WAL-18680 TaxID=742737 RepID=G5IB03_9FIRM|nr:hypothetical protein [Hungatella hathewayi]EHI61318.1 hypothetical protein HMPREF9473_00680 [ [Hungatella hathewayi WAL-18680]
MRKQTKLVAVLSAAALLAIGASMTSFAAQGWTEEDGTWVYLDKDGYKVTDSWKKSGNFWYYLDEDGYMATSKLIENGDSNNNTYYVDETGRMVANDWVELENEDYYDGADDDEPETVWYYFQNSGKAYKTSGKTSFKTINGKKYAFDENGHMLWGWVGETSDRCSGDIGYQTGVYYCGAANDGARVSGDWRYLYIGTENRRDDSEDDTFWFYFDTNGKKVYTDEDYIDDRTPSDDVFKTKKINGKTYAFDTEGKMINKWSVSTVATASDIDGYFSTSDDGARKKGWFQAVPSASINPTANSDDEAKWFYANNDGSLVYDAIKTVNSKKYAFNEKGEMLSGLWALKVDNNVIKDYYEFTEAAAVDHIDSKVPTGWDVYYFGDGEDGAMKTGTQTVEVDGERYQFAFGKSGASKGKGVNAPQGNILYSHGKRIKADSDYRYQVFETDGEAVLTMAEGSAVTTDGYLVNASGSIMKGSGLYTDSDGRQFRVTKNPGLDTYTVTYESTKN